MITLTGVEVSHDYSHAKIFYTTLRSENDNFLTGKGWSMQLDFCVVICRTD